MPGPLLAAKWLSKPKNRRRAYLGGIAVVAVTAGALIAVGATAKARKQSKSPKPKRGSPGYKKPAPKGTLLCPVEEGKVPVSGVGISRNDFVIVKLQSKDKRFVQEVWGRVSSYTPKRDVFNLELVTPLTKTGLAEMYTDKHGFHLGEKIKVKPECFYDVLSKGDPSRYNILCGVLLADLGYKGIPVGALTLQKGDLATIVVGNPAAQAGALPGKAWREELHVYITSVGKTGDVLRGQVISEPKYTDQHHLTKHTQVEFTRDCVVET